MTCIIGLACPESRKVWIGGDSAGVAGTTVTIRADGKVFRNGPFVLGFTTSFRMGQILRYAFEPPEHPEGTEDLRFLVARFIPAARKAFKDGGFGTVKDGQDAGGTFLAGYRGRLYQVDSDYQVGVPADGVAAVGCGSDIALGAMYALQGVEPQGRIVRAFEITARLNSWVRPPFVIEELSWRDRPA